MDGMYYKYDFFSVGWNENQSAEFLLLFLFNIFSFSLSFKVKFG